MTFAAAGKYAVLPQKVCVWVCVCMFVCDSSRKKDYQQIPFSPPQAVA